MKGKYLYLDAMQQQRLPSKKPNTGKALTISHPLTKFLYEKPLYSPLKVDFHYKMNYYLHNLKNTEPLMNCNYVL